MKFKKCNVCNNKLPAQMYKNPQKKTCMKCEFRWWRNILRLMVRDRRLTPAERMASRVGYMGTGFLIAGQWTVEPIFFIVGFIMVLIQVLSRKQWNLVALQLNGLIAWSIHFFRTLG
jgi:hypothetical protein